ncbi:MAG TPA: carbohydrate ABC transporter permease, partial [Dongiaceae bacterium]
MGRHRKASRVAVYTALIFYTLIAIFPIALVLMNSFKTRAAIFGNPLLPPGPGTFTLTGFQQVLEKADFVLYFGNSLIVTIVSLLLVLLIGAMAAWALGEYRFRGNALIALYMAIGIMVPIRLGTVSILKMVVAMNLINTLTALVLVYTAMGLPLAILILGEFMAQIPRDL